MPKHSEPGLPDGTYVELVRSLFATLMPTTVMGIIFIGASWYISRQGTDYILHVLAVTGSVLSLARVALLLGSERTVRSNKLGVSTAIRVERLFAWLYIVFALILGLFGARALATAPTEVHMLVTALLVGYSAGVASGVFLRPWIALPAVVLAVTPSIASALISGDSSHLMLGVMLALFMAGGLGSMFVRYRDESASITLRRLFGNLARSDPLTGLANRLELSEQFEVATSLPDENCLVAVHCLDLDRFKPINDQFGHPFGDELLRAVGGRLRGVLRSGDIAARIGGDEFVVLQTGMKHAGEAELMARRILRSVCEPYALSQRTLVIGTSIGFAVSEHCTDSLEDLVARADAALYRAKAVGGSAVFSEQTELPEAALYA